MTSEASAEYQTLRKENPELKRANEILKTASAFFAPAERDRRCGDRHLHRGLSGPFRGRADLPGALRSRDADRPIHLLRPPGPAGLGPGLDRRPHARLAEDLNPRVRGWINYYGAFYRFELSFLVLRINAHPIRWAMHKFNRLKGKPTRAWAWLNAVIQREPRLFAHWWLVSTPSGRPLVAGWRETVISGSESRRETVTSGSESSRG